MKESINHKYLIPVGYALLFATAATIAVYFLQIASHKNSDFILLLLSSATAAAAAFIFVSEKLNKVILRVFFWLYIEFFLRAAIYGRSDFFEYTVFEADARRLKYYFIHKVNLVPFKSISLFFSLPFSAIFTNILGNVGLMIPPAFLSPIAYPGKRKFMQAFLTGVGLSLFVEFSQFFFMCGVFDVDDLILNGTGALLGALIWRVFEKRKEKPYIFT